MTARAGMANLIKKLRALTATSATDYTVDGEQYWTDDQLQQRLDATRTDWRDIPLITAPENVGGTYSYFDYAIPAYVGKFFEESGTDSGWAVKDASGNTKTVVTDYAVNYDARMIRFTANQSGANFRLDCRTYKLYAAAAQVWEEKAAAVGANIDWQTDNHSIKASQEYDHYMAMAKEMRRRGGGSMKVSTFIRTDEVLRGE